MTETQSVDCVRCGESRAALPRAPFRNEIGDRILREICATCWAEWLQHQTLLINHYGLDPRDASSKEFLYDQITKVLFGEGDGEGAEIDTSRQGTVDWEGG